MFVALFIFLAVIGLLLFFVDRAPKRGRDIVQLAAFVAPALILLTIGLVYPAIRTILQSTTDSVGNFVGLENFAWIFTNEESLISLRNTVLWVVLTPLLSTVFGLAYAIFIDRSRGEKILKSLVFMPMAISFVGAGIIWSFMYAYRSPGFSQTGLLNQILVWLGFEPVQFLNSAPLNTVFLIVVLVWIQTGFAMVVLSASIKAIPAEQVEAARIDGASGWQVFRNVTLPGIRSSLVVVVTTITIATLKVFDIVRTMTNGNNSTSVVALDMYNQAFRFNEWGRGAALAVVIFVLVLPIVIYNVRVLRQQREIR
ncbi:sugar ABC transporter permease [Lysinibacter sp. HNR]|uniref:carbohydrate ABC transporter permease n=1 Tax=Lysinibacter sp. HNR TaxID=3031408 RepID=UPI0024352621|nr:sugar ABC transporter permease [Lysinibacter sp. HNR]WGD38580.1 sugar ABC transporter permease [Lysinibacter sp. HNR]